MPAQKDYSLHPELIYKNINGNLMLVSIDSDHNKIFKFTGESAVLLLELLDERHFTFLKAKKILEDKKIDQLADLQKLWDFWLEEKIFIPYP